MFFIITYEFYYLSEGTRIKKHYKYRSEVLPPTIYTPAPQGKAALFGQSACLFIVIIHLFPYFVCC